MSEHKVLYPTDLSEESKAALEYASAMARDGDRTLIIAFVDEPVDNFTDVGFTGYIPPEEYSEIRAAVERVVPTCDKVKFEHRVLTGHPAESIVECAKSEGVEMIVMGTHGRTGLTRVLMGSVAEAVVREAPCPVLTVRNSLKPNKVAP